MIQCETQIELCIIYYNLTVSCISYTRLRITSSVHCCDLSRVKTRSAVCTAGVRAGEAFQPAALPVWTGACRAGPGAATDRDPGENMVPESTLQDEEETGVGL